MRLSIWQRVKKYVASTLAKPDRWLIAALGGEKSKSGQDVTPENAMQCAAVYASVRVIAESVAQLPLILYKRTPDGGKVRAVEHPLYAKLAVKPNGWQTSFEYREAQQVNLALRGNAYSFINRAGGRIIELIPLHPDRVTVEQLDDFTVQYRVKTGEKENIIPASEMHHVRGLSTNGLTGLSPIRMAREAIGLSLATEEHGARLFQNGARPGAIIKRPKDAPGWSDEAAKRFLDSFREAYSGENLSRTAMLEDGMEFQVVGMTSEDAQFLECVVPGTMFSMADGTRRPAESLVAGDEVLAWDNGPVRARVAAVGSPPVKPLVRIKTARGRELTATFDHPCLIKPRLRTPGGRADTSPDQWTAMGCLKPGAYVRVGLGSVDTAGEFDADKAWYLGAMVGDGYIRKLGCSFSNEDEGVLSEMRRVSWTMGGDLRHKGDDSCDYAINTGGIGGGGSEIRTLFNESGLVGTHSDTKRVPEMVMSGGAQAWAAFLSGYLDTDGSVGEATETQQPKVYWSSVSRELLEDCQHLLAMLGINSAIYPMDKGGPREVMGYESVALPSWGLYVTGAESLRALSETLSPKHTVKRERLAAHADLPASRYRAENWLYDCVAEVEHMGPGQTVGVEIEGVHTHITAGLVTHNTRKYQRTEIASIFRVPPHMIGDLERATFSNIEHQSLEFVMHSLMPWLRRWEQAISRDLLTEKERETYFAEFLVDGLLRGDIATRYQAYNTAINAGFMSRNEVRLKENMNPADGLDEFLTPLNMTGESPNPDKKAA